MKKISRYIAIIAAATAVYACGDDDNTNTQPVEDKPTITVDGRDWTYNPSVFDLDIPRYFPETDSTQLSEEVFQLGRHLFYERRLSRNNTVSCASCHQQDKAFTDGRAFSIGLNGEQTSRGAMSLVNLVFEDIFFWDGRSPNLEHQALLPIEDHIEMDLTLAEAIARLDSIFLYDSLFFHAFGDTIVTAQKIARALATFERGIISKDSKFDKFKRGEATLSTEEQHGLNLFTTHPGTYWDPVNQINIFRRGGNCGDCHTTVLFSKLIGNQGIKNNGLEFDQTRTDDGYYGVTGKDGDKGKFKTPSLRNIALTAPYMHDGRFNTLEEVLDHYNEHVKVSSTLDILMYVNNDPQQQGIISPDGKFIQLGLTQDEKDAIVAFLKTLTDEELITNPRFSNPFIEQ